MPIEFKNKKFTEILPERLVNIEDKQRSNLFTWRGQFSPQLIEQILLNYGNKNQKVFDPFLGSGTVLYECALLGLNASGCDVNPAAIALSQIYELINKPREEAFNAIKDIEKIISKYVNSSSDFNAYKTEMFQRDIIKEYENSDKSSSQKILLSLITGMDFGKKKLNVKRIDKVWNTLISNIEKLPFLRAEINCYHADSRKTPIKENSIDLVITSPPYINVFNYHQNYRKSIEKVGIDVLSIAKSEIGANRKFRQNRFLTVVQYCMDMSQVFTELKRVCRKNSKIFFIVGRESNVRRTPFKNAKLISSVASTCGFDLIGEQPRVFLNKFGESIFEEILRFEIKKKHSNACMEESRIIGQTALKESLQYCQQEVKEEILEAIYKSQKIEASPIFEQKGKK